MCRAGKRHCKENHDPAYVAARNARRRAAYAAKKSGSVRTYHRDVVETVSASDTTNNAFSSGQEKYFEQTMVRHADGSLINCFHGSNSTFDNFDADRAGRGTDAWGSGFYFTDKLSAAKSYGANVKSVYLDIRNPYIAVDDGDENVQDVSSIRLPSDQVADVLRGHPFIYNQPSEDDDMNPIGDYIPEFWDKDSWTKPEMDAMIDRVASEQFSGGSFMSLEWFFGRDNAKEFRESVYKATGHDGIVVRHAKGSDNFYIAWFPEQIKSVENKNPARTSTLMD